LNVALYPFEVIIAIVIKSLSGKQSSSKMNRGVIFNKRHVWIWRIVFWYFICV